MELGLSSQAILVSATAAGSAEGLFLLFFFGLLLFEVFWDTEGSKGPLKYGPSSPRFRRGRLFPNQIGLVSKRHCLHIWGTNFPSPHSISLPSRPSMVTWGQNLVGATQ